MVRTGIKNSEMENMFEKTYEMSELCLASTPAKKKKPEKT